MSLMFTNPADTSATTPPSVEVWTKDETIIAIPVYESVHSVNGKVGNVVLTADDIKAADGQTLEDVLDDIGPKFVSEVAFSQATGNPVILGVTTRFMDGSAESTVDTQFATEGHLDIRYDSAAKQVIFNGEAAGLYVTKITGSFAIPEPGTLFVWTTSSPPAKLAVRDLVLVYDNLDMPTVFGVVREINPTNVVLDVVGSSYRYSAVKNYATRAAFPPASDAQERFFYVATDTGLMYGFINGDYKALNDGGVLVFSDVSAFPSPGDYHFLYLDQGHGDMYAYLGSHYVLLNDGGVIETDALRPRPAVGNAKFLYIDMDTGHIYAWIIDRYVMLNEGGVIFVDNYIDLPVSPNEKFLYGVRNTGNIYAWLKSAWILLNDGGIKTVSSINPRPATGDPKFLYADTDTGLVYAWVVDKYIILNDGGIRIYAQRADFPSPGDYRFLCIDQSTNDIYAYLGTQYVLLNEGGIRKVATPADLPATPNDRFLFQVISTNDIYAWLGGQWVLLNDGGVLFVNTYADLPAIPNTRFIYGVLADNKLYARMNNIWVLLNREGGSYIGVYMNKADLPTDRGFVGDFAIVKRDETTSDLTSAIYVVGGIDNAGVRSWIVNAPLRDIIGPKFLGYFYSESAIIARISASPGNVNINDFAILLDNNQSNPSVPVLHEPPNAANRVLIYIVRTITPSITLDNQVYIDSKGSYKGTFATVADLPTTIMFSNQGAKKGDWVIVRNNGANRSAIYVIDDYNVLTPSVDWSQSFIFPQIDIYDALDGNGNVTDALSANQGYVLDQKIQVLEQDLHLRGTVLNAFASQRQEIGVLTAYPSNDTYYKVDRTATPMATFPSPGAGYAVNDMISIATDISGEQVTFQVVGVDGGGGITAVAMNEPTDNGLFQTQPSTAFAVTSTSGVGTGATAMFATIATNGSGFGYIASDALILSNSDADLDAIVIVETVDTDGGVLTLTVSKAGSFQAAPTQFIAVNSGSGRGAIIDVTTQSTAGSTLSSIVDPTANDIAIVLEDEIHSNTTWQWIYADYNGDGIYNWVPLAPHGSSRNFYEDPIQNAELANEAVTLSKLDRTQGVFEYGPAPRTLHEQVMSGAYLGGFDNETDRDAYVPDPNSIPNGNWISVRDAASNGGGYAQQVALGVYPNKYWGNVFPRRETLWGKYTYVIDSNAALDRVCDNTPGYDYSNILVLKGMWTASPGKYINTSVTRVRSITGMVKDDGITASVLVFSECSCAINDIAERSIGELINIEILHNTSDTTPKLNAYSESDGIYVDFAAVYGIGSYPTLGPNVDTTPALGTKSSSMIRGCSIIVNCTATFTTSHNAVGFYVCYSSLDVCRVVSLGNQVVNKYMQLGYYMCSGNLCYCSFSAGTRTNGVKKAVGGFLRCSNLSYCISDICLGLIGTDIQYLSCFGYKTSAGLHYCYSYIYELSLTLTGNIAGFYSNTVLNHCISYIEMDPALVPTSQGHRTDVFNVQFLQGNRYSYCVAYSVAYKDTWMFETHFKTSSMMLGNYAIVSSGYAVSHYYDCYAGYASNPIPNAGSDTVTYGYNI
jgi:hypothetical protein